MGNVLVNEASLQDIADAIREKNGTETLYKPSEMADAVRGIESGDSSEFEESYWLENLNGRTNVSYLFYDWQSEKVPYFDTSKSTSFQNTFAQSNIKEIPSYDMSASESCFGVFSHAKKLLKTPLLNIQSATRADSMFNTCSSIQSIEIENTGKVSNFGSFANVCGNVKSIKTLDLSSATNVLNIFNNCAKLEELLFVSGAIKVSIKINSSPLLSAESIQSIIDGLAVVETAQTLTLHADVKAKLTEEQIATITSKNWTVA